jgi:threonine synthase
MQYFSTNNPNHIVDFKTATRQGQAVDGGLYFPKEIIKHRPDFINELSTLSKAEIAFHVIKPYVGNCIDDEALLKICKHTIDFNIPLVPINANVSALELYHGPTLAFKDVGARFMSSCLGHFLKNENKNTTVLVATSGDTGSAVANGFYNVPGVEVIILYPKNKVSHIQELQLTTLGNNITALEVDGTFDDCQSLVKQAFTDVDINKHLSLTSANSINVARWLPQQFYYYYAYQQYNSNPLVISVPSGNFGNICAGLLAKVAGLPIAKFVAACNANQVFTHYLNDGIFKPQNAIATISNAMDVGNPSNFVRIMHLFNNQYNLVKDAVVSYSISDAATVETIHEVYQKHNYILDPHGAVAYAALMQYSNTGIILETAHPIKFNNIVEQVIKAEIPMPTSVTSLLSQKKQAIAIGKTFELFKQYLLAR